MAGRAFLSDALLSEHERSQTHRDMLPQPATQARPADASDAGTGRKALRPESPGEFDAEYFQLEQAAESGLQSASAPRRVGSSADGPQARLVERMRSARTRFFDFVRDFETQLSNEARTPRPSCLLPSCAYTHVVILIMLKLPNFDMFDSRHLSAEFCPLVQNFHKHVRNRIKLFPWPERLAPLCHLVAGVTAGRPLSR